MNKFKYNVLIVMLVVIIGGIVLFSSLAQDVSANETEIDIRDDVVIEDEPNKEETKKIEPFTTGWQAFNYAYNIFLNGKGYYSETSQNVTVVGMSQKTNITRYRNDEGDALMETWCDGTISFFEGLYQNGSTVTNRKYNGTVTNKVYPDGFKENSRTLSLDAFANERGWLPSVIPHVITKDTASVIEFREKYDSVKKKNYYFVSFEFNEKANEQYLKQVLYCANTTKGSIEKVKMSFWIDCETGYLTKTIKDEQYTINYMGIPVSCKSRSLEVYHIMNQKVVINKPSYM